MKNQHRTARDLLELNDLKYSNFQMRRLKFIRTRSQILKRHERQ